MGIPKQRQLKPRQIRATDAEWDIVEQLAQYYDYPSKSAYIRAMILAPCEDAGIERPALDCELPKHHRAGMPMGTKGSAR